ncbi:MAG TPA: formate dehydrogenase-N subunit alpha [Planctomycetota bacterium]|nr:formate dehydrogenase-N subunit alpha [Planctomycetota bacterium]
MASLAPTFGRGAMTNGWTDIQNADVVLAMGGNPAENHPCGFKWVIEAKKKRGAKLVSVDPRFNRTSAVADHFVPIRSGTDIAFLGGLIRHAIENKRFHEDYVRLHTNALFLLEPGSELGSDGLFGGFDGKAYDRSRWKYVLDEKGFAKRAASLDDPACVFQHLRRHFSRYTPETVSEICGCPTAGFLKAADIVTSTGNAARVGTVMYALGWTQHSSSVQIIRAAAILQLLLGNVGRAGGGVNALRGHANIQGGTDHGVAYHALAGYLAMPRPEDRDVETYLKRITPRPLSPTSMNYWGNTPKFFVSLMKATYGKAATAENGWAFDWLPKIDDNYSWVYLFDRMYAGKVKGLLDFGMNPVANGPNSEKMIAALGKLEWLVIAEAFETETAQFWKVARDNPQTEVFLLPAAIFAEKDGSFTNSSRWAQWKWKACDPPGEAKPDEEILARIAMRVRELYAAEGGPLPEPVLRLDWSYKNPWVPSLEEVAHEINGRDLATGRRLSGFAELKADGTTSCGNWLYCGSFPEAGNLMARRDSKDPSGLGRHENWAWNWPMNRRVLYNRAGADAEGRPWDPARAGIEWTGAAWAGDVPDLKADAPPGTMDAFIMLPEGVAKLWAPDFADGPFPEHYEAAEHPVENALHPKTTSNPVAPVFTSDLDALGTAKDYPIVATTFRLTEHFHYWTKHVAPTVAIQPEFFVEIPEGLAAEKGIRNEDRVRVTTPRGAVEGRALVTPRLRPLKPGKDGKQIWQIAIPIHWGFAGRASGARDGRGPLANLLTPSVVDPNSFTPEYKTFLARLEKIG